MIHYRLSFTQYYQHLVEVSISFKAQPQQQLWLPAWIPGSYLIREFSRHLESVTAKDSTGAVLALKKIRKNLWQLDNDQAQDVVVSYLVYAFDLSVRGAYVDDERLYVNPAAVCLAIEGQTESVIQLQLKVPQALSHFSLVTGLQQQLAGTDEYVLLAKDYAELIDSPFELAEQQHEMFHVAGIPHQIAISGRHNTNIKRLAKDLEKICQTEIEMFGKAPFDHYAFMVMATANSYGGLEHQTSTSLITPRDDLPKLNEPEKPSTNYQRFLGLCSHEYFHAWLVKFIRPHNFVKPDLHEEAYTSLLWIFEGFTSYYDDLILYRSGVIDRDAYLTLVTEQINRYLQNPGRQIQSVAESSFDAWIKYYRPDENSNNAGTSYYNKGALVALCLDLTLRKAGSSLDEVMRKLFVRAEQRIAVHEDTIGIICEQLTGQSFAPFLQQYVNGTVELPLKALLAEYGIELKEETKLWPMGLKAQETPQGMQVQQVIRNSAAAKAGVSAQDVIIAINGLKVSNNILQQINHSDWRGKTIECHAFRRDELKTFQIEVTGEEFKNVQLNVKQPELLTKWIS